MRLLPMLPFVCATLIPAASRAEEPDSNSPAKIQFEIDKAKADADKPYAGKSEKELTREERLEKANAENAAANNVLEGHGMDAKSYTEKRAKMGGEADHADVKSGKADKDFASQVKDLKDKDDAAKAKKTEDKPVVVEKGVASDIQNGVVVDQGIDPNEEGGATPPPARGGHR